MHFFFLQFQHVLSFLVRRSPLQYIFFSPTLYGDAVLQRNTVCHCVCLVMERNLTYPPAVGGMESGARILRELRNSRYIWTRCFLSVLVGGVSFAGGNAGVSLKKTRTRSRFTVVSWFDSAVCVGCGDVCPQDTTDVIFGLRRWLPVHVPRLPSFSFLSILQGCRSQVTFFLYFYFERFMCLVLDSKTCDSSRNLANSAYD